MASSTDTETVAAAEPIAPWFGGKRYLCKRIIERVNEIPHRCYAEPFVGMGGVFLRRTGKPPAEVINDINGDVVNLFRIVREHPDELTRQFDWTLAARAEFERLMQTPPDALTDIQQAARFAFLQRMTFGGVPATNASPGQISTTPYHHARLTTVRMQRLIAAAHRRLQRVHVECMDWAKFVGRYDKPFTLFYIDPPYWGHEADYGKGIFGRDDFARMAEILAAIDGRFILSLNDRPEVRDTFRAFDFEEVTTRYSANIRSTRRAAELLISN